MSRWERWTTKPNQGLSMNKFLNEQQSPAEMAAAMGLQSDGSGGYVDESGNVVARTVNNELVFYDPMGGAISAQSDGAELTQAQPSWKDPVTGQVVVPPGQPESPEEIAAIPDPVPAQAPAGYNAFMNKKKQDMYANQATPEQEEIDTEQQEVDPQLGMQPEVAEGKQFAAFIKENELTNRMASAYDRNKLNLPRAQQVQKPVQQTQKPVTNQPIATAPPAAVAGSIARGNTAASPRVEKAVTQVKDQDGDGDIDIDDLRKTARESWSNWTTKKKTADHRVEQNLQPALNALNAPGVDPKQRNRILHSLMNSYRYQGRDNEASSDLNKAEFHALRDNKQRILEGYGGVGSDGSTHNLDSIRQFQSEINNTEMDDALIDSSFNALSPLQQKIFGGGDMTPRQGYGKFLRQGGNGGYTGLPLDYRTMQMEHFIDHTQARDLVSKAKAEGRDMTPEEQELHDFIIGEDNQFWSRQSPNEQKSSRSPAAFYDERVNPLETLGDDFFDYRELTVDPARMDLKGQEKEMISHLIEQDEEGNRFLSDMSPEQFSSHEDAVNEVYSGKKKALLEGLTQSFDPKQLMKLGPKAFDKLVSDEMSEISEEDRPTYDMLRNLQSKVKGYNPNVAYRMMQGLGLSTGFIQSERARTGTVSPAYYQAIASQLPGKSREEQKEFLQKVSEMGKSANRHANSMRGQGLKDVDIRNAMYQHLLQSGRENGILSDEVLQSNPELMKLVTKYLNQNESLQDMLNVEEDDSFEFEDILDVIKELQLIKRSQQRPKGRLNFEEFKRYNN